MFGRMRPHFGELARIGGIIALAALTSLTACAGNGEPDDEADGGQPAPTTDPWENARRRGVEFRAVGNEPGWYMEIDEGNRIFLVVDYGEREYVFPAPAPQRDPATGRTVYRTSANGNELTVVLLDRGCTDVMSGQAFPVTAMVQVDGREYQGCGRRLS